MKALIFSDIHGNLPAFELMLRSAGKVDLHVSLGDVVDYGPWSDECVQLLESLKGSIKILGNHEEAFLKEKYDGENTLTQTFFKFCIQNFKGFSSLKKYKKKAKLGKFTLKHTIEDKYIYPDSEINLKDDYIIGHTHYQFVLKSSNFILLNPGSVGQNRQYINIISFIILDLESNKFEMKNIKYDVGIIISEMKKRGYPKECIKYYENKPRL